MRDEPRLPEAQAFTAFFRELAGGLDPGAGWYGVFLQSDPAGIRACVDGDEIPPWDVVEALLSDLETQRGPQAATRTADHARRLHRAALHAVDLRHGSEDGLRSSLAVMGDEQRRSEQAMARLRRDIADAANLHDRQRLADELAWVRDDHRRAQARGAELRERIEALRLARTEAEPAPALAPPRGARFAGAAEAPAAPVLPVMGTAVPEATAAPAAPAAPRGARFAGAAGAPAPRGARFAGATGGAGSARGRGAADRADASARAGSRGAGSGGAGSRGGGRRSAESAAQDQRAAAAAVVRVRRLRAEGRSGEAYAELSIAAAGPPEQFPHLVGELERSGLGADVTTLLWEAASLPAERLAAVAASLSAAGRDPDSQGLLRQSVARPVADVATAALALAGLGAGEQAGALLAAFVRNRTADEAVELVRAAPERLSRPVLVAAGRVSEHRRRDVAQALRSAGLVSGAA
ncbi:hypothetical protein AB0M28_02915 [Streptomyces sp. NPDC051940]|uniref:hypothetical protein n=1 Tax=Streptomyces sp. NPDC051940 TaxID=3155675 RepID=UPI00341D7C60